MDWKNWSWSMPLIDQEMRKIPEDYIKQMGQDECNNHAKAINEQFKMLMAGVRK